MSYRVEIASQVEIDHVGLSLQYRRADTLDRRVCGLLRPIAERTRLEIGFKDRFQDQLQCSLYHPVPDRWNGQLTNSPAFLGYFHLPYPFGSICPFDQLLTKLFEKSLQSVRFNKLKRHPVNSRSSIIRLCQPIRFAESLSFANVNKQPPKAPRPFGLRLDV